MEFFKKIEKFFVFLTTVICDESEKFEKFEDVPN